MSKSQRFNTLLILCGIIFSALFTALVVSFYETYEKYADPYPFYLSGVELNIATFIFFAFLFIFGVLFMQRKSSPDFFKPTRPKLISTTIVAILTPVANLLWLPIPLGLSLILWLPVLMSRPGLVTRFLSLESLSLIGLYVLSAYIFSCIALSVPKKIHYLFLFIAYVFGAYILTTLIEGITYI